MPEKLIIVESPAKVHTIKKFLGSGYDVIASQGHIRDLPKSTLGVDVDHDFEPKYITIRGKSDVIQAMRKAVKKADIVYLATDPDREGEAISWHISEGFDLSGKKVYRITFNEITKNAVKEALKKPGGISMDLVNAQQARRVLDRVVGYELSPVLWKKVKGKLSAGRVQSAVLSMVCEREKEIASFVPEEYWTLSVKLQKDNVNVTAEYYGENGRKKELTSAEQTEKIEQDIRGRKFVLEELKSTEKARFSPYPFTTSTLQQDAANRLNFSTSKTMRLAQELYEGVRVTGRGTIGLITYLRTDSTRISDEADASCKAFIAENYGREFVGGKKTKENQNAQDAHEAIRPTDVTLTPESVKEDLSRDLYRLYQLIWKRFVASRMKAAVYDTVNARFSCGTHTFAAASSHLKFAGYLSVYDTEEEKVSGEKNLLKLSEKDELDLKAPEKEQHFTAPPPHYTESTLVRAMEENGLGRPSTYAPTISNILARHYITKEGRQIFTTELGEVVNNLLETSFPDIVDVKFTAAMEEKLDDVAEGKEDWHQVMRDFYPNFEKEVKKAEAELTNVKVQDEVSDVICDKCGRNMVIKFGPHGKFLACPGFPECRNTKPYVEKAGVKCPKCGSQILILRTKKGRRFYGCENRECDFVSWTRPKAGAANT